MKISPQSKRQTSGDELAAAKLWAVYISEADKYDKTLVENWKSDMDGILIFAGLFSAILTAFLIESYKTLSPDQGAITIAVLAQISLQLEPRSNASSIDMSTFAAVPPSPASMACNTLWFISLWLSLSSALIATLVEQWARNFIQRTEMRPSPIIRARIFAYLYYGLSRFGMHAVVESVPLLLHISLLLFFAGLVAFLRPINPALTIMTITMLALLLGAYIYLTVLPMFSSDSPYQTPLSTMTWGLYRSLGNLFHRRRKSHVHAKSLVVLHDLPTTEREIPTMVEVMNRDALQKSPERDERDTRAIVWTIRSLTDDDELEPLVQALPDLVRLGPSGTPRAYDRLLNMLLGSSDIYLVSRIESLLRSCDSGLLPPDVETRRRISSIKALWAVAYWSTASTRTYFPVFDPIILVSGLNWDAASPAVKSLSVTAHCLGRWSGFCAVSAEIRGVIPLLKTRMIQIPTILRLLKRVQRLADRHGFTEFSAGLSELMSHDSVDIVQLVQQSYGVLNVFKTTAYDILMGYMLPAASLPGKPFEFDATCSIVLQNAPPANSEVKAKLRKAFYIIMSQHSNALKHHMAFHHIDTMVGHILHIIQESPVSLDKGFAIALTDYICSRESDLRLQPVLGRCNAAFIGTLLTEHLTTGPMEHIHTGWTLHAIFRLCCAPGPLLAKFDEATLAAVCAAPKFAIASGVTAVLKSRLLMAAAELSSTELDALMEKLKIPALELEEQISLEMIERLKRGQFGILMQFLEYFTSVALPDDFSTFVAISTIKFFWQFQLWRGVPQSQQSRFAAWLTSSVNVAKVHSAGSPLQILDVILDPDYSAWFQGFDDPGARRLIRAALNKYMKTMEEGDGPGRVMALNRINYQLVLLKDDDASVSGQFDRPPTFDRGTTTLDSVKSIHDAEGARD